MVTSRSWAKSLGGRKGRLRGAERNDRAGSGCAGAAPHGPKGCSQPPNAPRLQLGSREMPKPSSQAHSKHAPQPCAQLQRAQGLLEADTNVPPAPKPHIQSTISPLSLRALTDLAGGHVQHASEQVPQGAVLVQLLLGAKRRHGHARHRAHALLPTALPSSPPAPAPGCWDC